MEAAPDSAMTTLEKITFFKKSDVALHSLLLTEARYKAGFDDTNDSLISIAVAYYDSSDTPSLYMRAHYQRGMIRLNASEFGNGIVDLLKAERTASDLGDDKMKALINRSLGDAFSLLRDYPSANTYYTGALEGIKRSGESKYLTSCLMDAAVSNYNISQYDSCLYHLAEIEKFELESGSNTFRNQIDKFRAKVYCHIDSIHKGLSLYESIMDSTPEILNMSDLLMAATAFDHISNLDRLKECQRLMHAVDSTDCSVSYLLHKHYGEYAAALSSLENEVKLQNSVMEEVMTRDYASLIRGYYNSQEAMSAARQEMLKERLQWFGGCCILLVILLVIGGRSLIKNITKNRMLLTERNSLIERFNQLEAVLGEKDASLDMLTRQKLELEDRHKRLSHEIAEKESHLSDMTKATEIYKKDVEHLEICREEIEKQLAMANMTLTIRDRVINNSRSLIQQMVWARFEVLNDLFKIYHQSIDSPNPEKFMAKAITKQIESIVKDKTLRSNLYALVNEGWDNLMDRFKRDNPGLNDWEYDLYMFLVLRLSNKAISLLQNIKVDNVYVRKRNIIDKLRRHNNNDAQLYIDLIQ